MNERDLTLDGVCGGCKRKVRLRIPNPIPGAEITVRCCHCAQPMKHTVTQKEVLSNFARLNTLAEIRREHFASKR